MPRAISEGTASSYNENVRTLIDSSQTFLRDSPSRAKILRFSREAYADCKEFQIGIEIEMREGGRAGTFTDWASKLPGAAATIAGLFHVIRHVGHDASAYPIEANTMAAALELAAVLVPHAAAVFGTMGADPIIASAQRVVAWLERKELREFTARDCLCKLQGHLKTKANLAPVLQLLSESGYIRRNPQASEKRSVGAPSEEYLVHPAVFGGVS